MVNLGILAKIMASFCTNLHGHGILAKIIEWYLSPICIFFICREFNEIPSKKKSENLKTNINKSYKNKVSRLVVSLSQILNSMTNRMVPTPIWGHDNSYTRHFVHTNISYKNQNQTFRTKAKPDFSYKNETRHFVQK